MMLAIIQTRKCIKSMRVRSNAGVCVVKQAVSRRKQVYSPQPTCNGDIWPGLLLPP